MSFLLLLKSVTDPITIPGLLGFPIGGLFNPSWSFSGVVWFAPHLLFPPIHDPPEPGNEGVQVLVGSGFMARGGVSVWVLESGHMAKLERSSGGTYGEENVELTGCVGL